MTVGRRRGRRVTVPRAGTAEASETGGFRIAARTPLLTLALLIRSLTGSAGVGRAQDRGARLLETVQLRHPSGSPPFRAMMLVPVCSGMSKKENAAHYDEMAELLGRMGYLVA